jgi:hypothetical protein
MTSTVVGVVYFSMTVIWATLLETVYTTDVMEHGWQSSVVGGGTLLGQALAGFGIFYLPKVKWQAIITSVGGAAFFASLASINANGHAQLIVLSILGTTSIGWADVMGYAGVTLLVEDQDIGLAAGDLNSLRSLLQ